MTFNGGNHYLETPGSGRYLAVTEKEAVDLIKASEGEMKLFLRLLWSTGARLSEIINISFDDINTKAGIIKINRLKRRKAFIQNVPIPRQLAVDLHNFVVEKGRETCMRIWGFSLRQFQRHLATLSRIAIGRAVSPKHFRHGKCYDMISRNIHPILLSRAMGHASMATAMNYGHPSEDDLRDALGGRSHEPAFSASATN